MMEYMRRIKKQMHRYGEPDFDAEYLDWGFHDTKTQIEEAESVLRLVGDRGPQKILDLACGIGTHAIHWAKCGHSVLGVDISETFVARAREAAEGVHGATFLASDIRSLDLASDFTLVTWIEMSFIELDFLSRVCGSLQPGGLFICDARNPEHPKTKACSGNWRTWREKNGAFTLERHETNSQTGKREDVWITIDPAQDLIEEKSNVSDPGLKTEPSKTMSALRDAGFSACELRTMAGDLFCGGCEPYWLWIVAKR
jgi:SAM-dependent methyltransferase